MKSWAASASYPKCPKCGAERGEPCRTAKTKRVTDTHLDRWWRNPNKPTTAPTTRPHDAEETA